MRLLELIKTKWYYLTDLPVSKPTLYNWIDGKGKWFSQEAKIKLLINFLGINRKEFDSMLLKDRKHRIMLKKNKKNI